MATLILTDAEKAAALWSEMDDAALGCMLRKKLVFLQTAAAQMEKTVESAAALLLCCNAAENNAEELRIDLEGVTQSGADFGDWLVVAKRKPLNV